MRVRIITYLLVAALMSAVALAGCGGASSESGAPPETRTMTPDQYRLLRKAHMELGQFIDAANQAIQPTSFRADADLQPQSLSQRAAALETVIEKYEDELPGPPSLSGQQMTPEQVAGLEGTLTGAMLELDQALTYEDEKGVEQSEPPYAWYPANRYLVALNAIYALDDFESYLLQHTKDEGATINPDNPPDQMDPSNETKAFGSLGVNISWDPSSGRITYRLGPNMSVTTAILMSIPELEHRFIIEARDSFQVGDGVLINGFKG